MKHKIKLLITLFGVFLIGCNDSSDGDSNPLGIKEQGGTVTFLASVLQDQQGIWRFHFKPSVDVKITKVEGSINNQAQGSVAGDGTTVFTVADGFSIEIDPPNDGEVWAITITGKIASDNKDFNSTVNYTVPQGTNNAVNNVTFQVSTQQGQQGGTVFLIIPSVDIKIEKVDVTQNNQASAITGDGTTTFTSVNGLTLGEYTTTQGDVFTFAFTGKIANDRSAFTSSTSYTIP